MVPVDMLLLLAGDYCTARASVPSGLQSRRHPAPGVPQDAPVAFGQYLEIAPACAAWTAERVLVPRHWQIAACSCVISRNTPVFGPPL